MSGLRSLLLKSFCLILPLTTAAAAQDYPTKTGRIVIPFPPGAINDTIGRIIATQLGARLGKQFIADNRPGAGGIIAHELVAHAPKDGHTLLIVSSAMTVAPWLRKSLPYDTVTSFAPIAIIATAPAVVAANPGLPAKTAGDVSHWRRSSPASCNTRPRASARSCIWPASCSSSPPARTSCTSRSRARVPP